jgi:hypothetical protein
VVPTLSAHAAYTVRLFRGSTAMLRFAATRRSCPNSESWSVRAPSLPVPGLLTRPSVLRDALRDFSTTDFGAIAACA